MGSLYEGKKVKGSRKEEISGRVVKPIKQAKDDNNSSEWNVEALCGFLSEEMIKEVMIKTGLVEEDEDGGFDNINEPYLGRRRQDENPVARVYDHGLAPEKWPETWMSASAATAASTREDHGRWASSSCSGLMEEPLMGWIWYPYSDEELMSFEDEEVDWEFPPLWSWKDINGNPNPLNEKK